MNENLYKLFRLQCQDLLVLAGMEYNGMLFAAEEAHEEAVKLQGKCDVLLGDFHRLVGNDCVSITSGDDISAVLYGGVVEQTFKVAVGHYKSGERKGEVKYKNEILEHNFERLVTPIAKTESAKNLSGKKATWSVGEDILMKLKATGKAKQIIATILEYRGVEKIRNTYLTGWGDLIKENCWQDSMIHGNLNQCVAITGRLSSSEPNLQNANKAVKKFLRSRYVSTS